MEEHFLGQMDYLYFVYGLAFLLLAVAAQAMMGNREQRRPWAWLAAFGILHGVSEWLDLLTFATGESRFYALVWLVVAGVSFLCLLEFGRAGTLAVRGGTRPKRWVLALFVTFGLLGSLRGIPDLAITIRYALAFPGGLWSAWALLCGTLSGDRRDRSPWLILAGGAMLVYAVAAGTVVPPGQFWPASAVNTVTFEQFFGAPIQLVKCSLACVMAVALWFYRGEECLGLGAVAFLKREFRRKYLVGAALVVILVGGWGATEITGRRHIADRQHALLTLAQGVAAVLDVRDVEALTGRPDETNQTACLALRERCRLLGNTVAGLRYVYVMRMVGPDIVFLSDVEPDRHAGESDRPNATPGERYDDAPAEVHNVFWTGQAATVGPYSDKWGSFVSAFAPLRLPGTQHVVAVIGIDVDASLWARRVAAERMESILITALVVALALLFFVLWDRSHQDAEQRALMTERLQRQQAVLWRLAIAPPVVSGNLHQAARLMTEAAAPVLDAARVGVWIGNRNDGKFICVDLYDRVTRMHSEGMLRRTSECPKYFRALEDSQAIAVHDCLIDVRLDELSNAMAEHLIVSALHVPIKEAGRVVGVLVAERCGMPRAWREDEIQFVGEAADELAHTIMNAERREAAEALAAAHQALEERVRERTAELHRANEELRAEMIERKRLEDRMRHAQKMESLGVMAGGIAHDFNNILMAILGNLALAREDSPADSPIQGYLAEADQAAHRAADLSQQMLAYSGRGYFSVRSLNLNDLVADMLRMIEVSVPRKVKVRVDYGAALPAVKADVTQMRQILMNLVINAGEAIGDAPGSITIGTGAVWCDRERLARSWLGEQLPEGQYTYVEVVDTGCGMDADTIERIFDPFFTTKFTGRGLGLAATLGIMRGHHGAIELQSAPKKGTLFRLLLPTGDGSVVTPAEGEKHPGLWHGNGLALLVDDEEPVLALGKRMLERLGLRTIVAREGREAVQVYRERHAEIDCVLLDLTMPELNGRETYDELRTIRTDVRVILCSGYNEDEVSRLFKGWKPDSILHKPYSLEDLSTSLQGLLEPTDKT